MLFNPHTVDPTNGNNLRLCQKTSGAVSSKLFGLDYLASVTTAAGDQSGGASPTAFTPENFAHYPSQGFDCIFTDGSVQFVQSVLTFNLVSSGQLVTTESIASNVQYNQIFNWLENGN